MKLWTWFHHGTLGGMALLCLWLAVLMAQQSEWLHVSVLLLGAGNCSWGIVRERQEQREEARLRRMEQMMEDLWK